MKISEEFCGQGNSVSESLKELTGLYGLSKTLRFELKPENETKEKFDAWIQELENANDINESIKNGKKNTNFRLWKMEVLHWKKLHWMRMNISHYAITVIMGKTAVMRMLVIL